MEKPQWHDQNDLNHDRTAAEIHGGALEGGTGTRGTQESRRRRRPMLSFRRWALYPVVWSSKARQVHLSLVREVGNRNKRRAFLDHLLRELEDWTMTDLDLLR
ncbi:hypothetical protein CRENBAI_020929 [Crenichthys baileyi]|uniref:Uncharacterized protein n=1 Tax=Crenichthys baileyi TaxID=28760 RepID=A0AAV9RWV9_9TELE